MQSTDAASKKQMLKRMLGKMHGNVTVLDSAERMLKADAVRFLPFLQTRVLRNSL